MTTIDEAIETLNRIHATDPAVLQTLIDFRVPCNEQLADDPTVQVGRVPTPGLDRYSDDPTGYSEVGLLGIINGLFGVDDHDRGFIAAAYDGPVLIGFQRTPLPASAPTPQPVTTPAASHAEATVGIRLIRGGADSD